jgi:hypothetical protein
MIYFQYPGEYSTVSETEIVGTCLDMVIQPYTALYSSIKNNGFADWHFGLFIYLFYFRPPASVHRAFTVTL